MYGRGKQSKTFGTTRTKRSYKRRARKANKFIKSKKSYQRNKKLLDKKINTLLESRMQEIAQDEIEKNLKVLTSRKYLYVKYNPQTNDFQVIQPTRRDLIDWEGRVTELTNIPKTDMETLPNIPQAVDDLDTAIDETVNNNGVNTVMIGDPVNGYRFSDIIYIRSLSAQLRIRSFGLTSDDIDIFQTIKIKYAFIMVTGSQNEMYDPLHEPSAKNLLRMDPWGYKSSLDPVQALEFNQVKSRILCQGETTLNMTEEQTSEVYTVIHKKFDKPLQLVYESDDMIGQKVNHKIYFVTRSTIPYSYTEDIKPSLYACTKINYYET